MRRLPRLPGPLLLLRLLGSVRAFSLGAVTSSRACCRTGSRTLWSMTQVGEHLWRAPRLRRAAAAWSSHYTCLQAAGAASHLEPAPPLHRHSHMCTHARTHV